MLRPAAAHAFSSRLLGAGFHRTVEYSWTCKSAACKPAGECSISIIQPLPAALFPDMYQLDDIARMSSSRADAVIWRATLDESLIPEGTEGEGEPIVLVVQARSSVAHGVLNRRAILRIPLHARYAVPVKVPPQSAGSNWATSPTISTAVPLATLLLSSADGTVVIDDSEYLSGTSPSTSGSAWDLPAGSKSHGKVVAHATSVAVLMSCTVVVVIAGRQQAGR